MFPLWEWLLGVSPYEVVAGAVGGYNDEIIEEMTSFACRYEEYDVVDAKISSNKVITD